MRFNTFRYLVKEGFHSLSKNPFMSVASVLVLVSCLLITGCAYLVFENVEHGFDWAYQQNVVVAYTAAEVTENQYVAIGKEVQGMENVESVELISKAELLDKYKDEFGDLLEDLREDNPLPDSLVITFKDLSLFEDTVQKIRAIEGIETVDYNTELSATLVRVRNLVLTIGMWVIALLLLVSLFIIANTIKLTVYNRRLEISIMRAVGATRGFIRFPIMVEGLILGFIAGALSYGLLFGLYTVIRRLFTFGMNFQLISFGMVWWQLLIGFIMGGVLVGLIGSAISTGRYLKERTE